MSTNESDFSSKHLIIIAASQRRNICLSEKNITAAAKLPEMFKVHELIRLRCGVIKKFPLLKN